MNRKLIFSEILGDLVGGIPDPIANYRENDNMFPATELTEATREIGENAARPNLMRSNLKLACMICWILSRQAQQDISYPTKFGKFHDDS
jgi:hypothetical protein